MINFLIRSTSIIFGSREYLWLIPKCQVLPLLFSVFSANTLFEIVPHVTFFYPFVRCLAFDVSDFLAEVGGLMGLLAGISVFSIIELVATVVKCFKFAACKPKVAPKPTGVPRNRKQFLVNRNHLLYRLSKTFVELLKESNIHGVHYTSDKKLCVIERFFWFITICMLLTFCSVLVFDSLNDLQSKSVIVTIDEKIWSVEDVRLSNNNNCQIIFFPPGSISTH